MVDSLPELEPVFFILGAARSGTTLLRVMLEGHPDLFSPPEMLLAPFATMGERRAHLSERFWERGGLSRALMGLESVDVQEARATAAKLADRTVPEVYAYLQERLDGRTLVDKCPHLCGSPDALERIAGWFPDARYLWLVRHPGSVTRSIQQQPMAELMIRGYSDDVPSMWYRSNIRVQRFLQTIPADRWTLLKYEELVTEPRPVMEQACRTLGLAFHEALLDPYAGDRMREGPREARAVGDPGMAARGRIDASLATRRLVDFDAGELSQETHELAGELGYDLLSRPRGPVVDASDAMGGLWKTMGTLETGISPSSELDEVDGRRFLLSLLTREVCRQVGDVNVDGPEFARELAAVREVMTDSFTERQDARRLFSSIARNRFVEVPGERLFSTKETRLQVLWFVMPPTGELLIRGQVPRAAAFEIGLHDAWLEQLYSAGASNRFSADQLPLADDGTFLVTLSRSEPRGPWFDPGGREEGFVIARTLRPEGDLSELTLEVAS